MISVIEPVAGGAGVLRDAGQQQPQTAGAVQQGDHAIDPQVRRQAFGDDGIAERQGDARGDCDVGALAGGQLDHEPVDPAGSRAGGDQEAADAAARGGQHIGTAADRADLTAGREAGDVAAGELAGDQVGVLAVVGADPDQRPFGHGSIVPTGGRR